MTNPQPKTSPPSEQTFRLEWVNKGQPFVIGPHLITPRILASAYASKNHVLKTETKDLQGCPDEVVKEILAEVRTQASIAQANSLVYGILCGVDDKVREMGLDAVVDRLTLADYTSLMQAVGQASAKAGGPEAPLADA